jgi:hypothetical protein
MLPLSRRRRRRCRLLLLFITHPCAITINLSLVCAFKLEYLLDRRFFFFFCIALQLAERSGDAFSSPEGDKD